MHSADAEPPRSLEEYAPRSNSTCTVCTLPTDLIREVETARTADPKRFTYPVIAAWLSGEHHKEVSDSSLRRHFSRGHHARSGA